MAAAMLIAGSVQAQTAADRAAVEALPGAFTAAWGVHDGRRLAALMAERADFINVGGAWFRGRKDFEAYHTRLLAGRFREAEMTVLETKSDFVRPDLALVWWSWRMTGDRNFDGSPRPPRVGVMTMLAEKQGAEWKVRAAQNTNGMPGPPLPEEAGITFPIKLPEK